ncbi:unnamed protein product [Clonostachys rosea f. rosea IK726]|uniref:Uncharacterized protein n=1 Tax=Clonostachys rosea f. rosea IK726 TaxID=1349383 RepID=A0ACA9TH48_BIOOC|nr:unnamed protein product [Clonostachys rosea f. rosea IK726]
MAGYRLIFKGLVALCFLLEASANNSDLDDPRFIGYFFDAGKTTIERMTAPSPFYTKFTTSGEFAGPCPNSGSKCEVNTMCEDNTLSGPDITNSPCWRSYGEVYLLRTCLVSKYRISRNDYVVDNEYILGQSFDCYLDRNAVGYRISSTNDLHERPLPQKYIGSRLRL